MNSLRICYKSPLFKIESFPKYSSNNFSQQVLSKQEVDKIFWETIKNQNKFWIPTPVEEWDCLARVTVNEPADRNLLIVLETFKKTPGTAIDLGCGTGAETVALLMRGWKVIAIDTHKKSLEYLRDRVTKDCKEKMGNLTIIEGKMEEYLFKEKVQLINATQSLPFCNPKEFQNVWARMLQALDGGGIINGQFYNHLPSIFQQKLPPYMMTINIEQTKNLMNEDFEKCLFGINTEMGDREMISFAGVRKNSSLD